MMHPILLKAFAERRSLKEWKSDELTKLYDVLWGLYLRPGRRCWCGDDRYKQKDLVEHLIKAHGVRRFDAQEIVESRVRRINDLLMLRMHVSSLLAGRGCRVDQSVPEAA